MSKLFRPGFRNCAQRVQAKRVRRISFPQNLCFVALGQWEKLYRPSFGRKSDGLWKLLSTSSVKHSQEKFKFLETATTWWKLFEFFLVNFWDIKMIFCLIVENSLGCYQNCILSVRKNKLKQAFIKRREFSLSLLEFRWKFSSLIILMLA